MLCERFAARGCNIAVNYVDNAAAAAEVEKTLQARHEKATVVTIQAVSLTSSPDADPSGFPRPRQFAPRGEVGVVGEREL